jgi:hypothetical protein
MPSQLFMSMGLYIKRGDSLTREEKVSSMDRKSQTARHCVGPKQVAVTHC